MIRSETVHIDSWKLSFYSNEKETEMKFSIYVYVCFSNKFKCVITIFDRREKSCAFQLLSPFQDFKAGLTLFLGVKSGLFGAYQTRIIAVKLKTERFLTTLTIYRNYSETIVFLHRSIRVIKLGNEMKYFHSSTN